MKTRPLVTMLALATAGAQVVAQTPGPRPAEKPLAELRPPEIYLAPFIEGAPRTTRIGFIGIQRQGTKIGKPIQNITSNPGDDDQPVFLPDSSGLLFSANRDGKQRDIYRYTLASKALVQLTRTPDDESSPAVASGDGTFTTVRGSDARVVRLKMDGTDDSLSWTHGPIGSHVWVSSTKIAAVVPGTAGEPNSLRLIDLGSGTSEVIASNVGRSLVIHVNGKAENAVTFVHKQAEPWAIKELNPSTRKVREIATAYEGSEDLVWTPGDKLLMGWKSQVRFWEDSTERWVHLEDLKDAGVTNIARLAVSPDARWIALVSRAPVKKQ